MTRKVRSSERTAAGLPVRAETTRAARSLAQLRGLKPGDVDRYVDRLAVEIGAGTESLLPAYLRARDERPANEHVSDASRLLQAEVAGAALQLSAAYADRRVSPDERALLEESAGRLRAILAMRDARALRMLPRDVRSRLEERLFGPLAALAGVASEHSQRIEEPPEEPRVEDVFERRPAKRDGTAIVELSGGDESTAIESVAGARRRAAVFTSRGPTRKAQGVRYKSYNEDGAAIGVLPRTQGRGEVMFAAVGDQAGGMGKVPGRKGAASRIAVEALVAAAKAAAEGADPHEALEAAINRADRKLHRVNREHGVDAITTAAAVVVKGRTAHVVAVGDSKVWHFSRDGRLLGETRPHNLGDELAAATGNPNAGLAVANVVTRAIGSDDARADHYSFTLAPGDYLVLASDGLADANLLAQQNARGKDRWSRHNSEVTTMHIGELVARASSPEALVADLRDYALRQMKLRAGKPDNIAIAVIG